jgi:hypothetical protein
VLNYGVSWMQIRVREYCRGLVLVGVGEFGYWFVCSVNEIFLGLVFLGCDSINR